VQRDRFDVGAQLLSTRYELVYDPQTLLARSGFLAGDDAHRLAALNQALRDPTNDAVMMARGGYGLTRLLPQIDMAALVARPRPLIGFSDGTALLAQAARAGVAALHAPVVTQWAGLPEADSQLLFEWLENPDARQIFSGLATLNAGTCEGQLVGGNLEVLSRLLGTPFAPPFEGSVLLLEDVGERPYRIDRLLTHLEMAGIFAQVSGVVLGDFTNCDEPQRSGPHGGDLEPTCAQILAERLGRLSIPVAHQAPVGHGTRNEPVPLGLHVRLDTESGCLEALEGLVA